MEKGKKRRKKSCFVIHNFISHALIKRREKSSHGQDIMTWRWYSKIPFARLLGWDMSASGMIVRLWCDQNELILRDWT